MKWSLKITLAILFSLTFSVQATCLIDDQGKIDCSAPGQETSARMLFSDISNSVFPEAIKGLHQRNVIDGYPDSTFQPLKVINRAEFIKIIIKSNYWFESYDPSYERACFDDITDPHAWYVAYACIAKDKGIIEGRDGKYLAPDEPIQFVEAVKIIAKVYNLGIYPLGSDTEWYHPYLRAVLGHELIPIEVISSFNQPMPREIIAEIIFRALLREDEILADYLQARLANYQEDFYPDLGIFMDYLAGTPLTETQISQARLATALADSTFFEENRLPVNPAYQMVIDKDHPGEYVSGDYISNYEQWISADYPASDANAAISLEEQVVRRENMIKLLNDERKLDAKSKVLSDAKLHEIAQNFADHLVINGFYSHMDKFGNKPKDRAVNFGYTGQVAENMTWKSSGERYAIDWWKNSDLHRATIFNTKYNSIGVGVAKEPGGTFIFIALFGS